MPKAAGNAGCACEGQHLTPGLGVSRRVLAVAAAPPARLPLGTVSPSLLLFFPNFFFLELSLMPSAGDSGACCIVWKRAGNVLFLSLVIFPSSTYLST